MKIRINRDVTFNWKLTVEGESVDLSKLELSVEITTPSHKKVEIIPTIQFDTLVFKYRPNQIGEYIASVYINRFKDGETALDVKAFEGVKYSWNQDLSNDDNLVANSIELTGNLNYGPNLDIYLKIADTPFEKGSAENSAVLKDGNNQVISEGGIAVGNGNIVGLKGWYYKALNIDTSSETIDVYLTKNQTFPILGKPSNVETDIVFNLRVGDVISLVNDNKHDNKFIVSDKQLNNGFVKISAIGDLPFTDIKLEPILDTEDYSIYCLSKPNAGIADIGQASFVSGYNNKATNGKSTAFGFNNHAYGKFSFVEGRDNEAGYAAHAEGRETNATGEQSHTEGRQTIASGNCSHAEGRYTVSLGVNSHAEGEGKPDGGTVSLLIGAHGRSSHVEGIATTTGEYNEQTGIWSKGDAAHAEGNSTIASGNHAHAEGSGTKASGWQSHAEGHNTIASGNRSHAEGSSTQASGQSSHTEGSGTQAYGQSSHAEGEYTTANGYASHASGYGSISNGSYSYTSGYYTQTSNLGEFACGKFNESKTDTDETSLKTIFTVGVGQNIADRYNALEVRENGDIYIRVKGNLVNLSEIISSIVDSY